MSSSSQQIGSQLIGKAVLRGRRIALVAKVTSARLDNECCARGDCRDFALRMTWAASAEKFLTHVSEATKTRGKIAA